jgi:hypothetical protein
MFFFTHRATNSFTSNNRHYPAAVPLVICTAKPVTIAEAAEVLEPLLRKPIVAVPEVIADTYAVKYWSELETVTKGATLNLEAGNTTANVTAVFTAIVAT